jgi:DNA-binding FadR family transcriptional regulator
MARFGVSCPTLREAFRVLESEGLITVRRGARRRTCADTEPRHRGAVRRPPARVWHFSIADAIDARARVNVSPDVVTLRTRFASHELLLRLVADHDARAVREMWTRHVAEAETYLLGPSQSGYVSDLLG